MCIQAPPLHSWLSSLATLFFIICSWPPPCLLAKSGWSRSWWASSSLPTPPACFQPRSNNCWQKPICGNLWQCWSDAQLVAGWLSPTDRRCHRGFLLRPSCRPNRPSAAVDANINNQSAVLIISLECQLGQCDPHYLGRLAKKHCIFSGSWSIGHIANE